VVIFFELKKKIPLTMLLETFSYSEMMNFHDKKKKKKSLVNSFYLFKHYLLEFFLLYHVY